VLASFTTKFSVVAVSLKKNLKLAASRLDGHVLQPGQEFSFNEVVGARTEKEGYKIAHVITAGEMVDGLAGGACQISTTLHGAAFFSGLDIVSSTPHSRPSTYVQMGLDATVVYPQVDLKLRNSYDFPVVIHYRVARGESVVEILGKERPFDKVEFVRNVKRQIEFDTITREDDGLPVGSMVVEQDGFPGYSMKRYRRFYKDGKVVKTQDWTVNYRPVTEYVRLGINPDPNLPQPKQGKGHGPRPPRGRHFSLAQ
jgi:vancomycin resistance protein YoaR